MLAIKHKLADRKSGDSSLRVLVVEDDTTTAAVMRRVLEFAGFGVRAAGSYKDALNLASQWIPDVLVCDIGLPDKDGLALMKTLRRAYPTLKGIVVSGYTGLDDQAKCRDAGFSDYLSKPITAAQITSAIGRLFHE